MGKLRKMLLALDERDDGQPFYVKSRDIAEQIGITPRAAGARFGHIARDDNIPVAVESWSFSSGAATYRVLVDSDALSEYLHDTRDEPEPTLRS